jgi:hypothetical protein
MLGVLREEDFSEDPERRWYDNIEMGFEKRCGRSWTGYMWPWIATSDALLCIEQCTLGFRKMRENSWLCINTDFVQWCYFVR